MTVSNTSPKASRSLSLLQILSLIALFGLAGAGIFRLLASLL